MPKLGIEAEATPFSQLAAEDEPRRQRTRSEKWVASLDTAAIPRPALSRSQDARIKIGYFSSDFFDHATMRLMLGVLRNHDRSRFEIQCYSFGPRHSDAMAEEVNALADRFFDISELTDEAAARLAREMGLDIAVDLKGFTTNERFKLFSHRPAPIQIPSTSFVADRIVVPDAFRDGYSEALISLQHSYQPNGAAGEHSIADDTS